jgi:ring-1,2-phenylacetyl-CoA epoxidase subunit PaaD
MVRFDAVRADAAVTADLVWPVVAAVPDPEIPVLTIADLGILRDVSTEDRQVTVVITPTYSGCPALETIQQDIAAACAEHGWREVRVRTELSPAWTTDWMSEEGRRKLREYGIAPPGPRPADPPGPVFVPLSRRPAVTCPRCGSAETREVSRFGSTACKALYSCTSCREPFDHFRAI